ncbi:MAG: glycosyltransferase [Clostridiales bacterium]|nr:glycosyltransferase [Clostridiales bacterium]
MAPKVSIIIPSLNTAPYIPQCLESAVAQTLSEIEIICVDAGSTDGTFEILEDFAKKDNRIKLLHSKRKSYGYQVNMGLKTAKGNYIAILEADDFVDTDMYEQLFQIAEENNADFVRSYYYDHIEKKDYLHNYMENIKVNTLLSGNEIWDMTKLKCIWAAIYRRDFLISDEIYFNETPGASYQDSAFAFKVAICAKRAYLSDKAFYHYRNDNPNSSVHSKEKVYCVCDEVKEAQNFVEKRFPGQKGIYELLASFRFQTYLWNYRRLPLEHRRDFLEIMNYELLNDWNSGYLNKNSFKPHYWSILVDIIFKKEQFFWKTTIPETGILNIKLYGRAITDELSKYDNIIIYGAGTYGKHLLAFLRSLGTNDEKIAFAVSADYESMIDNIPCHCIRNWVHLSDSSLVIIAVEGLAQQEMFETAYELGFKNILILDDIFKTLIKAVNT